MSLERINATIKLYIPSETEWIILDELCELLEPLKDLTTSLSATKSVTISLIYQAIYNLINYTLQNHSFKNESIVALLDDLLYSLKNIFKFVLEHDLFVAATYLNFRFKKFEFIKDKLDQEIQLDRAKEFLKEYYIKRDHGLNSQIQNNANAISNSQMLSSNETPTRAQELNSNDQILTAKNSNRRKKSKFLSTLVDSDPVNASDIEFNIYDNINISQDENLKVYKLITL